MNRYQFRKLVREVVEEVLSRRDFLKKATVGGLGLAAGYGLGRLHKPSPDFSQYDYTLPEMPEGWYYNVHDPISQNIWMTKGPIYHKGNTYKFGIGANNIILNDKGVWIGKTWQKRKM
jgi:hypothetical protein